MKHKTNTTRTQVLPKKKPITSIFLDKDKRLEIIGLQKDVKRQYASYDKDKDALKRSRLRDLAEDMWNSMQNEFYHSSDISVSTIAYWQDEIIRFNEEGYLFERKPEPLSEWTKLCKSWYDRNRTYEVLNLIRNSGCAFDGRPEAWEVFQSDFKQSKTNEQFCSAILKWTDLTFWSPWKLDLYDSSYFQPRSAKYEDEFNPDVDDAESDIFLD